MSTPEIGSHVCWEKRLYQVHHRSRSHTRGSVTLWLCECGNTICSHSKIAVSPCKVILMLSPIDYYEAPKIGDVVVIAAAPFIEWLKQKDREINSKYEYNYDRLPPRLDKLDQWFWVESDVVRVDPPFGQLKHAKLGHKSIPLNCLRVLRRNHQP